MSVVEKREQRLPKFYNRQVWEAIHEWFGERPQMNPPRVKDLLNPGDHDMNDSHNDDEEPEEHIEETLSQTEEEQHLPFTTLSSSSMPSGSPELCSVPPPQRRPPTNVVAMTPTPPASPYATPSTPLSVSIINLSDASSSGSQQRLGNTGQKQKNSSLQNNITDVVK
jgi:hypothetical protein